MTVPTPSVDPAELAAAAHGVREFGSDPRGIRPLYHRLCSAAAADPEVVARLWLARPEQRRINLLLAAVHDVLLAGQADPLARWYSSVTTPPHQVGSGADDPWPHFRRLALDDDGVAERLATRSTQTNEVGRCATTALAFRQLQVELGGTPLGLVEVGASAGLNLLVDRYGYDYALPDGSHRRSGPDTPVVLSCQVRAGAVPAGLPSGLPGPVVIASRVGLDLHPVAVADPAQARWLVACQWPDQPDRIHRLRAALAVAHAGPPVVQEGDAVHDLAPLVGTVAPDAHPVVVSTWALAYLPEDRQRAFLAELDRLGAGRDLTYVFAEQPAEVPGLAVPAAPDGHGDHRYTALVRLDWRAGRRTARRLADQHPHGTWVTWFDGAG